MRPALASTVVALVASLVGCNALTGVSDLEPVDCVGDCAETDTGVDAHADAPSDARTDSALDAKGDALADSASDADADAADGSPDAGRDAGCVLNSQCDDENACTKDLCNGVGVCTNPLVDDDGDGEASTALGACGLDCHDGNKDVFSAQTQFFDAAYSTPAGPSFDYDCDGVEERQHTSLFKCVRVGSTCEVTPGWSASVPACGTLGTWVTKCLLFSTSCIPNTSTKIVQRCR